jgi:hypothetical protein
MDYYTVQILHCISSQPLYLKHLMEGRYHNFFPEFFFYGSISANLT